MGWKRRGRRRRRRRRGGTSSVLQRLSQQYPNFFIVPTTFLCGHSAHHIFLTTLLYSHKLPAFPLLWSVNVISMELKRFCQMSKLFGCVKLEQATIWYDMLTELKSLYQTLEQCFCRPQTQYKITINGRFEIQSIYGQSCWCDFKVEIKADAAQNSISVVHQKYSAITCIEVDYKKLNFSCIWLIDV